MPARQHEGVDTPAYPRRREEAPDQGGWHAPDQLGADPAWLATLSPETGTHAGPLDTTPGAPHGTRTRPVWPEDLWWALVLPLLLLDLLLRRVALGKPPRTRLG